MAEERENIVFAMLRDIRAERDEHSANFKTLEARAQHVEKQVEDLHGAVTYSLGQSTETQFRQVRQAAKIDELFARLEKLMASEKPL